MAKVLITGASSYVGARFFQDLSKKHSVVGTYFHNQLFPELIELDLTDSEKLKAVVSEHEPEVIIHIAAHASTRTVDQDPQYSEKLNLVATQQLLTSANDLGAKFIYMSSFAAINDTLYGKLKREAEDYIKANASVAYALLRPSVILGLSPNTTNDRPFNRLLKNLTEHTSAVYDDSWKFQPTYLRHLVEVTQQIIERGIDDQLIHVAVPSMQSRFTTARDILTPFGIEVKSEDLGKQPDAYVELAELSELGLPEYSYQQMVEEIVEEVKSLKL